MIWTNNTNEAVKVVGRELKEATSLNNEGIVMLAENIVKALAEKNLIKEEED